MRIVQIVAPAAAGGLESVVRALSLGLSRRGHDVSVVAILPPEGGHHPFLASLDSAIRVVPVRVRGRAYLRERAAVAALVGEIDPHIVHTHGYKTDVIHGTASVKNGRPVVSTIHGFTGGDLKNRWFEWMQLRAVRNFSRVVAVSEPLLGLLTKRGVPLERIALIRNAWDGREFANRADARKTLGLAPDRVHVGFVGRLSPEKGPDLLLDAAWHLADDCTISFVGDGRSRPSLENAARRLTEQNRVVFHGTVEDAGRLIRAFDVVVLSSRTEGTPIVLLEAIAAGVPVVAHPVGGIPGVVGSPEAWLVPVGEGPALAEAITAAVSDTAAARERCLAASQRLREDFDLDEWLAKYEDLYESVARDT